MEIQFNLNSPESYAMFLKVKALPRYRVHGRTAQFPDEYAALLGLGGKVIGYDDYHAPEWMFDYQGDVAALAIHKRKFSVFMEPGYGKTLIFLEFAKYAAKQLGPNRCVLIVSPLMVIRQTMAEAEKFYGGQYPIQQIAARDLQQWLKTGSGIGITNYEAITPNLEAGRLGALIIEESSMLKSMYGKWGTKLLQLGEGLEWKSCYTGTPAPNDRIEYANHAVFMDAFPTQNAFLSRYFVNRGQTSERWEMKPHALAPFYRGLSDWSIFVNNPATYGWKDNTDNIPPINIHVDDVPLTEQQREAVSGCGGDMFGTPGGVTSRTKLAQIAKGNHDGEAIATCKPAFVRRMVESWPDESTIIWCRYNAEQETIAREFAGCANLSGDTSIDERQRLIDDFKDGRRKVMVSKAKILGFGLNLQRATRQVFSSCQDSYEEFYQCVKRSNRIGSTMPLNVHIPVTDVERPMMENVLRKAKRVQEDGEEQERLFRQYGHPALEGVRRAS